MFPPGVHSHLDVAWIITWGVIYLWWNELETDPVSCCIKINIQVHPQLNAPSYALKELAHVEYPADDTGFWLGCYLTSNLISCEAP